MNSLLPLTSLAVLLATGCGQDSSKSTATAKTNPPAARTDPSDNSLNVPANYLGAINRAKQVAGKTVDSTTLNRAIQSFQAGEGRFPTDLRELVKEGYMPKIPPPPYGMHYQYDASSGTLQVLK